MKTGISDFLTGKKHQVVNERSIAVLTMVAFYLYIAISWLEHYWYSAAYLNEFARFELATFDLASFDKWTSSMKFYDFIIFTFPALLLWKHAFPRLLFYGCFFALYLFPVSPNPSLTILGLSSQSFYSLTVAFVGFLICTDVLQISKWKAYFLGVFNSKLFAALVWVSGLAVVVASILGKRPERIEFAQQHSGHIGDFGPLLVGMPPLQIVLFLVLSCGVFINGAARVNSIILSWLVVSVFVPLRIEWNTYLVLVDVYVLLSAMLLWGTLTLSHRFKVSAS